jgi:fatty-acyl-CoA synthase
MPETPEGILDWLERAGRHPDRPEGGLRFVDRAEKATWFGWAEVRERALVTCGGLQALGIERGDRVALIFPTGIDFFAAFFGAQLAGAVPVPLYPPARLGRTAEYVRRTARLLERSGARLVLAEARLCRLFGEAVCRTLEDLPQEVARPVHAGPADLALIQFSSGTTVEPKPVALSHRAVAAQAEILAGFWPDTPERRQSCVSWLPLYHDMGLIGCVFPALARDATLTLFTPELFVARPALWLRTLSRYRATISPAPNFAYGLCLTRVSDADLEGVDLSGWQTALNGAESISPAVMRAFCERFAPWGFRPEAMTPVYGLSEAALAVTFSDLGRPYHVTRFDREELAREGRARASAEGREIVSVGRPVPGFRLRIVDPDGRDLPAGTVGQVWIQGPSLMDGYLGDPEGTARTLRDGWLDTGDLGFMYEGELYLAGRAKDAVILRGRNHAPEEIERAVDEVPGLRPSSAVAVSWLPEDAAGEELALFVEAAREAAPEELAALPDACREAVLGATGLAVDRLEILAPGALPRTSSGKLRRGETLRLYLAGELAGHDSAASLHLAGAVA